MQQVLGFSVECGSVAHRNYPTLHKSAAQLQIAVLLIIKNSTLWIQKQL